MTLKEKFKQWFINDEEEHYIRKVENVAIEHEKIADQYAIHFLNWYVMEGNWIDENLTNEELLKIFKAQYIISKL